MDKNYYINVKELMLKQLQKPSLKPVIFVTGWNEWLPLIKVETEV